MHEYVGDAAARLQVLLNERRFLQEQALSADAYERWGQGCDPGFEAEIAALGDLSGRIRALTVAFAEGVDALRVADPAAVVALARAHQALLDQIIAAPNADSTAVFVAREERAGWAAVEAGDASNVAQNCFYVHYEPARFERFFGFGLGWPVRVGEHSSKP